MAVSLPEVFLFEKAAANAAVKSDLNLLLSGLRELSSNTSLSSFFSNANGVSFGSNSNTVTASVATAGGASNFVAATAAFFGTNASGTIASNAISVSVAAGAAATSVFSNSNGVSWGTAGSTVTATVATNYAGTSTGMTGGSVTLDTSGIAISLPAYLTTAMASNRGSDFVQATATIAGTSISGTIASNVISLSVGPYITTAMASNASTQFVQANATIAGTSISGTIASNGISLSVGPYLTTAMQSGASTQFVQANAGFHGTNASGTIASSGISVSVAPPTVVSIKVSAGTLSQTLTAVTFADSNGVSWGMDTNSVITATVATNYQSSGAYLTTAMQSGASTQFVQANATIAGTNISGTIASNQIQLSGPTPGATARTASHWANLPALVSGLQNTLVTSNTSILMPIYVPYDLSIGWMRFLVTNSVAANTTMATSNAATTFTIRDETGVLVVLYTYGGAGNIAYFTSGSGSIGKRLLVSASASVWTMSYEHSYYTEGNAAQSSQATTVSTSNLSVSSDFWSRWTGNRYLDIPFAMSVPAGDYWIALGVTTAQTTAYSTRFSSIGPRIAGTYVNSQIVVNNPFGPVGANSNSSNAFQIGNGSITLAAQGTSSSLALANVSSLASMNQLIFEWMRTT